MDKVVNRVTVVQGTGPNREARTVYDGREEEFPTIPIDGSVRTVTVVEGPSGSRRSKVIFRSRHWEERDNSWRSAERGLRRLLKADMIRAREAYRNHVDSASSSRQDWWLDLPANMIRAVVAASHTAKKNQRADDLDADVRDVQAGMRDLKDDFKAAASEVKQDSKSKTFDTKTKVKGT